ncbi:putative serine protease HtrA [Actinomadura rubteroloni]|uniref:Putative serine protease HtrA n=1 Tax=Actinomadura rubteroloni TaxID=1926885 RepID=A0A2P4UIJ3_9ACTN|nr:trypsin-like peptidase domain-containing protein [Actinomadura rubteroloni]POM24875.1 putative serine protease HtrA [Actinomadura rubteroloni]
MTEENRSPSDDERPVAGAGAARQDDEALAARPEAPRATMIDQEQPVPVDDPEEPPAAPEPGDRHVAGGFTPPDGPADVPVAMPAGPPPEQQPRPWGSPAGPEAPVDPRQRPGFVPHDAPAHPYGWQGAPPQGPPLNGQPPQGARPMAGYGQQPPPPGTGPNWAPVPPPPPSSLRGPGLGLIAIIVAVVALVSAGVGAGVAVLASDDDQGTVSLGGDGGGGGGGASRPPDSVAGIARRVLPSVVMIRVKSATEEGAGTGFIVNGGYIVTNNHVAAGAGQGGQIQIVFNDKKTLPATVKGTDPSSDVAVLKPEGQHDLPALSLGNSDQIAVGDPVIAIGSPLGLQGSVTTGIVSSLNRAVPTQSENGGDATYLNAIQTDAAINPGNSGGPLVDTKGRVIGMNTAIATLGSQSLQGQSQSGSIGLGFAIPINQARRVAQEIINNGSVKQAKMGVLPDPRSQDGAKIMEQPVQGQQPITPGGPAAKAGLKPGDVITKVDSQPIEDASDLIALIRSKAPGDKIKVTYVRNGKENTVELTLSAG